MSGPASSASPSYDFLKNLQSAGLTASEQEKQARELLRELVFKKADEDPDFEKKLASDPERVVREAARSLPTHTGAAANEQEAQRIRTQVVQEITQEARDKYSTAIIGASEEQVTKLVFGTLENVQKSFQRTLTLSQWLFFVGLGLTVASFTVAVLRSDKELVAGIFGGGGILTLISYAVMNPLDRIRNAAANLVQLQIAYVSYYKQLTMLGDGQKASLSEAIKYSNELRKGAVETVAAVQTIVDKTAPYDVRPSRNGTSGESATDPTS